MSGRGYCPDCGRPMMLDLFCCSGGAGMGYYRAGFCVTGVDIAHQPNYPFRFVQGDALDYLAEHWRDYVAVHTSAPCQDSSSLTKGNRGRDGWTDGHFDLNPEARRLLNATGLPYVMENVQGSVLRRDLTLCGLMFGLKVFRHRYFELGRWSMPPRTCNPRRDHVGHRVAGWRHGVKYDGDMFAVYGDGGGKGTVAQWQDAMGIDWTTDRRELAEAIPPAFSEFIGRQLLDHVTSADLAAAA